MDIRQILSNNLRKFRAGGGFSQAKLAEKANSSSNYIAMIELKKKFPSPEMLEQLAKALNIETYELFSFPKTPLQTDSCGIKKFQRIILRDLENSVTNSVEQIIGEAIERAIGQAVEQAVKKTITAHLNNLESDTN